MKKSQLNAIYWSYREKELEEFKKTIDEVIDNFLKLYPHLNYNDARNILNLDSKYERINYKRALNSQIGKIMHGGKK